MSHDKPENTETDVCACPGCEGDIDGGCIAGTFLDGKDYQRGAEAERARIVAWLRDTVYPLGPVPHYLADAIERGDHA